MGWRDVKDLHDTDPDFGTGWLILVLLLLVALGIGGFLVYVTGSWLVGGIVAAVTLGLLVMTSF